MENKLVKKTNMSSDIKKQDIEKLASVLDEKLTDDLYNACTEFDHEPDREIEIFLRKLITQYLEDSSTINNHADCANRVSTDIDNLEYYLNVLTTMTYKSLSQDAKTFTDILEKSHSGCKTLKILDIGCGPIGYIYYLIKLQKLCEKLDVTIKYYCVDLHDYNLPDEFYKIFNRFLMTQFKKITVIHEKIDFNEFKFQASSYDAVISQGPVVKYQCPIDLLASNNAIILKNFVMESKDTSISDLDLFNNIIDFFITDTEQAEALKDEYECYAHDDESDEYNDRYIMSLIRAEIILNTLALELAREEPSLRQLLIDYCNTTVSHYRDISYQAYNFHLFYNKKLCACLKSTGFAYIAVKYPTDKEFEWIQYLTKIIQSRTIIIVSSQRGLLESNNSKVKQMFITMNKTFSAGSEPIPLRLKRLDLLIRHEMDRKMQPACALLKSKIIEQRFMSTQYQNLYDNFFGLVNYKETYASQRERFFSKNEQIEESSSSNDEISFRVGAPRWPVFHPKRNRQQH